MTPDEDEPGTSVVNLDNELENEVRAGSAGRAKGCLSMIEDIPSTSTFLWPEDPLHIVT
jgi:hypothetical protein